MHTGFTLIEIIVYLAIFAVLSVLVVETIITVTDAFGKARVKRTLALEGRGAMERMMREIRLATSVDITGSVLDTNPGRIKLNTVVSPSDSAPAVREFLISGKHLILRDGANDIAIVANASTTKLIFRHILGSDVSDAVRIELEIEDGQGDRYMSVPFYSTAVLRGSY